MHVKRQSVTAFVGGTSGVGKHTVRALASTHGTSGRGLRVYIAGRNEEAANTIIAECRKACPAGEFHFVCASDLCPSERSTASPKRSSMRRKSVQQENRPELICHDQGFFCLWGTIETARYRHLHKYHFVDATLLNRTEQRPAKAWKSPCSALLLAILIFCELTYSEISS
ncbi:hypothetical protein V1506DRAFT_517829 [Lipomyces tetrasporus]